VKGLGGLVSKRRPIPAKYRQPLCVDIRKKRNSPKSLAVMHKHRHYLYKGIAPSF